MKPSIMLLAVLSLGLSIGVALGSTAPKRGLPSPAAATDQGVTYEDVAPVREGAVGAPTDLPATQKPPSPDELVPIGTDPVPEGADDVEMLTEVEAGEQARAGWERAVRHHQEQPFAQWFQTRASPLLTAALTEAAAEGGFQLRDLDCRTSGCMATLAWADYRSALANPRAALVVAEGISCAVGTVLPPPDDEGAKYESNVFFENCVLRE